jgi:alpha-galactosidase
VVDMKKIAFIGTGSYMFARNLIRDILSYPTFHDATIDIMDIDEVRLMYSQIAVNNIVTYRQIIMV